MKRLLTAILVLSLAAVACGFSVTLPTPVPLGPEVTDTLTADYPAGAVRLTLIFGAGKLHLAPGAGTKLFNGTATYNVADFKPTITTDGSHVTLKQGEYQVTGFPVLKDMKNEWELQLGSQPFALDVNAGAYEATYDLGGLSLTDLTIQDGAASTSVTFSSANPVEMNVLRYETGASNVTISGLGNANFASLMFKSGAGDYRLDFSGTLRRSANVSIETGLSTLTLVIPTGVPATVTIEAGLTEVTFGSGWTRNGNTYTQSGSGPSLTILMQGGAGSVSITN